MWVPRSSSETYGCLIGRRWESLVNKDLDVSCVNGL